MRRLGRGVCGIVAVGILASTAGADMAVARVKPGPDRRPDTYEEYVVNGSDAPAAWTFVVALLQPGSGSDFQRQFCGGALIAPSWVLTAAHCVEEYQSSPSALTLLIGRHDLDGSGGDERRASAIHLYPGFSRHRIGTPDMALVELDSRSNQSYLPLMTAGVEPFWNDEDYSGVVAGWGSVSPSGDSYPSYLQSAPVFIWSDSYCADYHGTSYSYQRHVCAGSEESNACSGDSGGPMVAEDENGVVRLTGIVSFGAAYCTAAPGVFNQVSHYESWVNQVTASSAPPPASPSPSPPSPSPSSGGYWFVAADGGIFAYGAPFHGSPVGRMDAPASGMANTPDGNGYWVVATNGRVYPFGSARFHGDLGGQLLSAPIVDLEPTWDGGGYHLLGRDGAVYAFGNAPHHGAPVGAASVGMGNQGSGYWVATDDGGVSTYGAPHLGSAAGRMDAPAVGIATQPGSKGFWIVSSTGRVYPFGTARFSGDLGGRPLNTPVIDVDPTPSGAGYYLLAGDGGVFTFGDATFLGSTGNIRLNSPVVGLAVQRTRSCCVT